ncbi:MAG TPA: Uma2 family endonuclease [Pirellulales bacterium]|nr:Uma2 family endonuclease [Pirellulales bacterium]
MSSTHHVPLTSAGLPPDDVVYPERDGRLMGETPIHRDVLADSVQLLQRWFAHDPQTYISGNMMLYYVRGEPAKCVSPDVFVVRGVERDKDRRTYRVWEEEGRAPELVIEVTSRSSKKEDTKEKFALYRDVLGVREYFLFDPFGEYIKPRLKGYRLSGGEYLPIEPVDGRLPSEVAGLHLESHGRELRFYDPQQKRWVPTAMEGWDEAERQRTEAERRANEAVAALAAKEAEIERLRRELQRRDRPTGDG